MHKTRREFVIRLAAVAGLAGYAIPAFEQTRRGMPTPPPPAEPHAQVSDAAASPGSSGLKRVLLLQNEKEFRTGVEHLFELTSDLHEEVQRTTTTDVLSVRMYKKMEEIEKLAKQLKNKAKG